nr:hypothetical protein [Parabacteroides goldsteinii]
MKVESIKCKSIDPVGDQLILVLTETSFEEIESTLVGKDELSVFTDNTEEPELTEKHYDYAKADSCKYDYDEQTFTLTLRKLSSIEKEVKELRELVTAKSGK